MTAIPISLPTKVIDLILAHLIRQTLPLARDSVTPILAPLTTLPHDDVPNTLRCALLKLWWLSLDHLPPPHVVRMLVDLERTQGRPLMYTVSGLGKAALRGDFALMDAWVHAGLLNDLDEKLNLHPARHQGAQGEHLVQVYEWWLKHRLPLAGGGRDKTIETDLMLCSSSVVAGEDKCVEALELLRTSAGGFWSAPTKVLVEVSRRGYIKVLDWWWTYFDSGVSCSADAMVAAVTGGGHLHVLKWWAKRFPLRAIFKKSLCPIAVEASKHGHVDILHWWYAAIRKLPPSFGKYTEMAMDEAAANGHVAVLDFWLECSKKADPRQNLPLKYMHALNRACAAGHVHVLEWFAAHVEGFQDSIGGHDRCPLSASPAKFARTIKVECLEWRKRNGIPTEFSLQAMNLLRKHHRTDILDWIQPSQSADDKLDPPPTQARRKTRRGTPLARPSQGCIESALAEGNYALVDRFFHQSPDQVRAALAPERLSHQLVKVQFGIIEYLTNRGILNPESCGVLANGTDIFDLSHMAESPWNLPLVDWIRKHYGRTLAACSCADCTDPGVTWYDDEDVFELTERDLRKAKQRGDLGFCRWVKLHKVDLRDCWEDDTNEEYGDISSDELYYSCAAMLIC